MSLFLSKTKKEDSLFVNSAFNNMHDVNFRVSSKKKKKTEHRSKYQAYLEKTIQKVSQ